MDHHRTADYAGLAAALGDRARHSLATMEQLGAAKAILLVGNDPTEQNPLAAWQIRAAIGHHGARLYALNARPIKLRRKASQFIPLSPGSEPAVCKWLAGGEGALDAALAAALGALKTALEKESDLVIVFGAEVCAAATRDLVAFGLRLPGPTRFLALGDYANSRGAADMGLLPDHLPGYAPVADFAARERFGTLWGASLPEQPGLAARPMLQAAAEGRLKALYVVGANPVKTFRLTVGDRLGALELLVVQEMFLTETAQRADIVLPAACAYEKDGTVTNTAGEVQLLRKAGEAMGPRSDFDILRILAHQLGQRGLGRGIPWRAPEAVFEEIRRNVPGYDVSLANLLAGGAEPSAASWPGDSAAAILSADGIFSSGDTLFTSGSLGRYCTTMNSLPETQPKP